jgi:hypothetical protein
VQARPKSAIENVPVDLSSIPVKGLFLRGKFIPIEIKPIVSASTAIRFRRKPTNVTQTQDFSVRLSDQYLIKLKEAGTPHEQHGRLRHY